LEFSQPINAIGERLVRDEQALVLFFEFDMTVDKTFNQTLQAIQPVRVVSVVGRFDPYSSAFRNSRICEQLGKLRDIYGMKGPVANRLQDARGC
jgi:hypothetical protein